MSTMVKEIHQAFRSVGADEAMASEAAQSVAPVEGVATKADLVEMRAETQAEFAQTRAEMAEFKAETKAEFVQVRAEMAEHRAETKAEFVQVRAEMAEHRAETQAEFSKIRAEMVEMNAETKAEMKAEIAGVKFEVAGIYRHLWLIGTGLLAAMIALRIFA